MENTTLFNISIFSGYAYVGRCREFVWIPGDMIAHQRMTSTFVMRGLECSYEIDALMIRKDLYLRCDDGREYVVGNFQISDIDDSENISGIAESCDLLFEKFPQMKTITEGEQVLVSKQTQVMAFKVVSNVINSVRVGQSVDTKSAKEVVGHMVDEIIQCPDALMNLINIKSFDDYTFTHNINVATLSVLLGQELGVSPDELHELGLGALMHDVGKLKVSLSILNKDGKLTDAEFNEMKQHPTMGYEILCKSGDISEQARLVCLQHHEKFQGRGYPKGIKGEEISLFARICSVADVYDALTTDRPYRTAMAPYDAVKIIMSGVDSQFDPAVLTAFMRRFSIYPSGSLVMLSNGSVGLVLRPNPKTVLRPTIKLLRAADGSPVVDRVEIDLNDNKSLFITGAADASVLNIRESAPPKI
ncbi:MAG: HD-GYP domain-containing protein [Candidatus Riflebacteria bacterium]|nr:HD-GYP domain-containing protein [Candidatus Riflebacteria bacterium]